MSDQWQPALARRFHPREKVEHLIPPCAVNGKIVRVREIAPFGVGVDMYRMIGCDSERFFAIHPDDARSYNVIGCEHEILTD